MIRYTVVRGDYLAKIAAEHGTTWQAIWHHPANAEHRNRRASPDVLYPGDVLVIDTLASPGEPPAGSPPPGPMPTPRSPPSAMKPWPYSTPAEARSRPPSWDCPFGTCICHPGQAPEKRRHTIVFIDPFGKRVPNARVRVFQSGVLITDEGTEADARGELELEISATTKTLFVEWAPASLPFTEGVPFRCRYHVDLGTTDDVATARRLANLGFQAGGSLEENIAHFERALQRPHRPGSDIGPATVRSFHDRGELHPFALRSAFEDSPALSTALLAHVDPIATSHLAALADALGSTIPDLGDVPMATVSSVAPTPVPSSGTRASNQQGTVGPSRGFLHVIAFDIGLTPSVHDVRISARNVASIAKGSRAEVQKPAFADSVLAIYAASLYHLRSGRWKIVASTRGKVARGHVDVTQGTRQWLGLQLAPAKPRLRLSAFDFTPWFVGSRTLTTTVQLRRFESSRLDDYSLVHTVIPNFKKDVDTELEPGNEVVWDKANLRVHNRRNTDAELAAYLTGLIEKIRPRRGQVFVGYALVKKREEDLGENEQHPREQVCFPKWLTVATDEEVTRHADQIVSFFVPASGPARFDVDGIFFDIEIGAIGTEKQSRSVRLLVSETAQIFKKRRPDGIVGFFGGIFKNGQVAPHMAPFDYDLAAPRDGRPNNIVARTMAFDTTGINSKNLILESVDFGLHQQNVPPSNIQVAVDLSRASKSSIQDIATELSARGVGLAVMRVLDKTRNTLTDAPTFDAKLNPGADGPGLAGNPTHVPLQYDRE